MAESRAVDISVSEDEQEAWEAEAEKEGVSLPDFIKECVRQRMGFSPYFRKLLKAYSEGLEIPPSLVLESMVLARFAQRAAEKIVYDLDAQSLDDFVFSDNGAGRGRELEKRLMAEAVNKEVEEFAREVRDNLRSTANFSKEIHIQNLKSGYKDLEEMISRIGDYQEDPKNRRQIEEMFNFLREEIARLAGS